MFGYGFLSVVLALYLAAAGLDALHIGAILTLTLGGDAVVSLWLTTHADRIGRRRVLVAGALLMVLRGARLRADATTSRCCLIAATIGVISPSGNEVGPFLAVEQASLSQIVPDRQRTGSSRWYNLRRLVGHRDRCARRAVPSPSCCRTPAWAPLDSYRVVVIALRRDRPRAGRPLPPALSRRSRSPSGARPRPVRPPAWASTARAASSLRLSLLFALDAFAGGFVMQSLIAYWFQVRFGVEPGPLGAIFFVANILAGISALLAARIAGRIGLINTMVFTHLPSNVLLILVPADADPAARGRRAAAALLHQPDGRAHAPVLHHGRRRSGRAFGGRRRDRDRTERRRGGLAADRRAAGGRARPLRRCPSSSAAVSRSSTTCCSIAASSRSGRPRRRSGRTVRNRAGPMAADGGDGQKLCSIGVRSA